MRLDFLGKTSVFIDLLVISAVVVVHGVISFFALYFLVLLENVLANSSTVIDYYILQMIFIVPCYAWWLVNIKDEKDL